jgi:uncharacterized protein (TIGR02246 family)
MEYQSDETAALLRDVASIRKLPAGLANAWNAGDGAAYADFFTSNCDYIAFDGTHLKGRAQNASHHQLLFDTVLRDSRLVFEDDVDVRLLGTEVALMHAKGSVLLSWHSTLPPSRRSIQTFVLVRTGESWRIRAFQNARIRPMTLPQGFALRLLLAAMRLRTHWSRALART